jgi:hypothetical protein
MAFDTDQATVYQVRSRHRHQEVQEIIPRNYQGVMVTDRGRSYEARSLNWVKQQKCLAHLQKTLSTLLEKKKGRAREFGEKLKMLFRMALDLWEEYHAGAVRDFEARAAELRFVISYLLRERALRDSATSLPPAGRLAALSGGPQHRTHQQSGGTGPTTGGDCPQGISVLQE